MRKLILGLALSLATVLAQAAGLEGTWRSDDSTGGASPGTLVLGAKSKMAMQPDGFGVMTGTWKTDGALLVFAIPNRGEAVAAYALTTDTLALQYADGLRQTFKRKTAASNQKARQQGKQKAPAKPN